MNINRNNYEEFFLLYIDNELSTAERKAVELFVAQNTDLQEELVMLQQTVLKPSGEIFHNKETLLQTDVLIQEKLLLLLDGELSETEKRETEALINADANVATAWSIFQQTKLSTDESIIFADKASLYRKEPTKVVGIRWWRIAAAAMLISFGTWGTLNFLNKNKSTGNETVTTGTKPESIAKDIKKDNPADTEQPVVSPVAPTNAIGQQSLVQNDLPTKDKKQTLRVKRSIKELAPVDKNEIVVKENNDKPTNNLPRPLQNINNVSSNKTLIANVPLRKNESTIVIPVSNEASSSSENNIKTIGNASYAVNSDEIVEPEEENDNKKSKFRGLFRKVKRVFERSTNAKSGSNVMIAGFEIAIK